MSGNWKMNHTHFEAIQTVQKLVLRLTPRELDLVEVSVHPPFTDLRSVQTVIDADDIPMAVGAQDTYWEDQGPFTGAVSPLMLAKLTVSYVIVGHSERRRLFGETDETVALKLAAVRRHAMTPILCVGETLEEREAGGAVSKVGAQLDAALGALEPGAVGSLVVAYEPIWAIGTGRNASPGDAQEMCAAVRSRLATLAGVEAARSARVQYGGSVTPGNAASLMAEPDVDGTLVGGASLDADSFAAIVQAGAREG